MSTQGGEATSVVPFAVATPEDPTYGYDLAGLLEIDAPAPPPDFEEFWRALYASARAVDVAAVVRGGVRGGLPNRVVHDVEFTSLGGVRLGGWLSMPTDRPPQRGLVVGHGYGGQAAPDGAVRLDDAAVLFFCARGLPTRGIHPVIPSDPYRHVLHGIDSRETYVLGGCVADTWCAVSALAALAPRVSGRIAYHGISFGGGIGALALPWDERIAAACLIVPTFGNHPLRLSLPCVGSGEAVRRHVQRHPEVIHVLRYFDAATAATFIEVPTHVGLALADPAVPPPGQFAVYNALAGPRERFVLTAGHLDYPEMDGEAKQLLESQRDFLSRAVG